MFNSFNVEKTMFEDQFHERHQFSLNYKGNNYKGLYQNGNITWFHPHPLNDLGDEYLNHVETEVHEIMQGQLNSFHNFNIEKTMFEDHLHERYQFSLTMKEKNYKGIYHNGDILWFHPHPLNDLEEEHVNSVEEEVHEKMQDYIQ